MLLVGRVRPVCKLQTKATHTHSSSIQHYNRALNQLYHMLKSNNKFMIIVNIMHETTAIVIIDIH